MMNRAANGPNLPRKSERFDLTNVALCFRASRAEWPGERQRGNASAAADPLAGSAAAHLGRLRKKMKSGRAIFSIARLAC